jgi:hypothetical protein
MVQGSLFSDTGREEVVDLGVALYIALIATMTGI